MTPSDARRVLWLTKGLGRGGAEQLMVQLAARMDGSRVALEVAYVLPWKDQLVPELGRHGIPVHCLGRRRADAGWVLRLRRLVERGRFDVLHTHSPRPAVAARTALGRGGPVLVHTEHNTWPRYRWPTYWANRLTYARNARVIAVSDAVAHSITASARRLPPVEVLIHGVDASAFPTGPGARSEAKRRLGLDPEAPVVGTVGNLTPKKDHRTLLEAFASVRRDHPSTQLVLIGAGPLEHKLRALAGRLELSESVVFAGMRDDVPALLPAFDVFCLSSRHEGLPIALLEAMTAGLPAVVTDVGGVGEVVRQGAEALLVPPNDSGALAASLSKLLEDRPLRAALGARAQVTASRFTLEPAVARLERLYEEVAR